MKEFDAFAVILWTTLLVLIIIFITSCASENEMRMGYEAQARIVEAQSKIEVKETLTVDCSQGCGNAKVSYTDPRDRRVIVPTVTNRNDVVKASIPDVITGVGYVAGAIGVTRILKSFSNNMGTGNTTTSNTNVINGDSNTASTSSSKSESSDVSTSSNQNTSITNNTQSTETQDTVTTNTENNDNSVQTYDNDSEVTYPQVLSK